MNITSTYKAVACVIKCVKKLNYPKEHMLLTAHTFWVIANVAHCTNYSYIN